MSRKLTPSSFDEPLYRVCVFTDGDQYCAVMEDFENLQESPAGFGDEPADACTNLFKEINKHITICSPDEPKI